MRVDLIARHMARWLGLVVMIAGFIAMPAPPAQAHQDGCHRWHSCPSDTGSYICGDLGYYPTWAKLVVCRRYRLRFLR